MPTRSDKKIVVIAGPNGAGKTTFASTFLPAEGVCRRLAELRESLQRACGRMDSVRQFGKRCDPYRFGGESVNRGPESTNDLEHDIADVQAALARAARHARERARKFRTTVVIEENGQVQHLDPNEPDTSSTPNARRESAAPETAELRELRLSEYRKLSIDDRIQFIREICDSIAFDCVGSTELPGWQKRELDEALKAYSQNPDVGSGWAGVEARIRTGIREVSKRE